MSFQDQSHYIEFRTEYGWRWRVELLPGNPNCPENKLGGTTFTEWKQLEDDVFNGLKFDVKFDKLPVGLCGVPTSEITFDGSVMSAELWNGVFGRYETPGEARFRVDETEEVTWPVVNTWIVKTDYGNSAANYSYNGINEVIRPLFEPIPGNLAFAPVFFTGAQRITHSIQADVNPNSETCKVVVEHLAAAICKNLTIWNFGRRMLYDADVTDQWETVKRRWLYKLIQRTGSNFVNAYADARGDTEGNNQREIVLSFISTYNYLIRKYIQEIQRWYRLPNVGPSNADTKHAIGLNHITFFKPGYSDDGTKGAKIEDDNKFVAIGVLANSNTPSEYEATIFTPRATRIAGYEGETLLDAIANLNKGFAAKAVFRTETGLPCVRAVPPLSTIETAQELHHSEFLDNTFSITIGEYALRSAAYNIDTSTGGGDDEQEHRYYVRGSQSEEDYETKMILHNLALTAGSEYRAQNGDMVGGGMLMASPVVSFRSIYCLDSPGSWFGSNVAVKVSDYVEYFDGRTHWNEANGNNPHNVTPIIAKWDKKETFIEIQRRSGMPAILARILAQLFSNPNQAKLSAKTQIDKISLNHIGSVYNITLPGRYATFSGSSVLVNTKIDALTGIADNEFLIVPAE